MNSVKPSLLKMQNVRITEVEYAVNTKFNHVSEVDLKIGGELHRLRNKEKRTLVARLRVCLFQKELEPEMPFYFKIVVDSYFNWDERLGELSDEKQENIHSVNIASIMFSYIRPILAQLTSFSNLGTLNLPLVDLSGIEISTIDE